MLAFQEFCRKLFFITAKTISLIFCLYSSNENAKCQQLFARFYCKDCKKRYKKLFSSPCIMRNLFYFILNQQSSYSIYFFILQLISSHPRVWGILFYGLITSHPQIWGELYLTNTRNFCFLGFTSSLLKYKKIFLEKIWVF